MRRGASYGMRIFLTLWAGQSISAVGTGLGSFALGVWVYEKTGSATQFAMIAFVAGVTLLVLTPIAGVLADRWDRRKLLILSDAGSGVLTLGMAALMYTNRIQTWHVYPFVALMVSFFALQGPALLSSVSLLVPRDQLARASGMTQTARSVAQIIGPLTAGLLVGRIGYHGVILIDCITFLIAVATLLAIRIPNPPRTESPEPVLASVAFGWTYLRRLPGLLALLGLFAATNFCMGMVQVLLTPLILSFATPVELGTVNSAAAAGALLGGFALAVWGGPKRRVLGTFGLLAFQALIMFTIPILNGCNQVLLQNKVAPEVQGRVFAVAGMLAAATLPLASLIAGPLADRVFEPLLAPGGALAGSVGRVIGVGDGRGVGFLFVLLGAAVLVVVALASLNPRLRRLETEIPDALPEDGAPATPSEPTLQNA